jgi:hypothetical protein
MRRLASWSTSSRARLTPAVLGVLVRQILVAIA